MSDSDSASSSSSSFRRRKRSRSPPNGPCYLCGPELRDPLTLAISFMVNPGPFRQCSSFTVLCFNHAVYLDRADLPCAYVSYKAAELSSLPVCGLKMLGSWEREFLVNHQIEELVVKNLPELTSIIQGRWSIGVRTGAGNFLKHAVFQDLPILTEIGHSWMANLKALETVRIKNLPTLPGIGDHFLYQCTSLKEMVLQDLPLLRAVGSGWMLVLVLVRYSGFLTAP